MTIKIPSFRTFSFSFVIFIGLLLQGSANYNNIIYFYKINIIFPFLLLAIFFLPFNTSLVLIAVTSFFIDLMSSNINGVYLVSYFFSLLPVYFFASKIKQDFFLPVFLITFLCSYSIKIFLEILFHSFFYSISQAFVHFYNKSSLEIVLNTVFTLLPFFFVKMILLKKDSEKQDTISLE